MTGDVVRKTIKQAVKSRKPDKGLIIHSDRGSQYASRKTRELIAKYGFLQSMTTKEGKCFDNSSAESFFSSLKKELVHRYEFNTREDAHSSIFEYIESFYNRSRLHSSLDYEAPAIYEQKTKLNCPPY